MQTIKYFADILEYGHLPIPEEVRRLMPIHKGEKLEVILSYVTVKNKEDEILLLQKKIQDDFAQKSKKKLTLSKINKIVHKIRQAGCSK